MESVKTSLSGKLCKYCQGCFVGLPKGVVWKKKTVEQLLFSSGKAERTGAVALPVLPGFAQRTHQLSLHWELLWGSERSS